ncbi:hypothetical protein EfmJHP10_27220 [Enterococcus faecium]|nr:hypothetical protein EfmJHP10_27220 [Enterococcus faecium]
MNDSIKKMLRITEKDLMITEVSYETLQKKKTLVVDAVLSPTPRACRSCGSTVVDGNGKAIIVKNGKKETIVRFEQYNHMGLTCQIRIKRYKSYKGTVGKIAKNVLKRNFSVDTPNKKWVTDVTEFKIKGRKIYLSPILDLFNGEIISYSISTSPTYKLIEEMLQQAIKKKGTEGSLILHSDQALFARMAKQEN